MFHHSYPFFSYKSRQNHHNQVHGLLVSKTHHSSTRQTDHPSWGGKQVAMMQASPSPTNLTCNPFTYTTYIKSSRQLRHYTMIFATYIPHLVESNLLACILHLHLHCSIHSHMCGVSSHHCSICSHSKGASHHIHFPLPAHTCTNNTDVRSSGPQYLAHKI